jgi:Domain of Unknown Function (DUF1080)
VAAGGWNTMVIEFEPGTLDNDGKTLTTAAWIRVTLNTHVVFQGEIKDGMTNLTGTGSRGSKKPVVKGPILLQSHWGSQIEFRNPMVDVDPTITR